MPFVEVQGDAAGRVRGASCSGGRRCAAIPAPTSTRACFGEAAAIFAEALRAGYSGILFGRARVSVERMLLDVRRLVGPELAERVSAYKSGYRADERARIEAGLRSGQLRGVVSTNALELGIDVGALDLAVLAGYPGSTMSFWQQAGRVGRRAEREAVVVLVAGDDALDQYHIQHPEAFFGRSMEHAAVDPSNAAIQLGHLLCAASERRSRRPTWSCCRRTRARLVERLVEAGELSAGPPWRRAGRRAACGRLAARHVARRRTRCRRARARSGTIEPPYLQRECYPGRVYLHNGRGYRVAALDATAHVVRLEPRTRADARTDPLVEVEVAPRDEPLVAAASAWASSLDGDRRTAAACARPSSAYRESRRGQALTCQLEQPLESVLDTIGLWLDVPPALEADERLAPRVRARAGQRAAAGAAVRSARRWLVERRPARSVHLRLRRGRHRPGRQGVSRARDAARARGQPAARLSVQRGLPELHAAGRLRRRAIDALDKVGGAGAAGRALGQRRARRRPGVARTDQRAATGAHTRRAPPTLARHRRGGPARALRRVALVVADWLAGPP